MSANEIVRAALDEWRAGINARDPGRVAAVFTEDAIFQGLRPYSVGRSGIAQYYNSQPHGMTVSYQVLETRRPAPDVVFGYVQADFAFPDRPAITLNIGVLVQHSGDGWRIGHYQASQIG